MPLLTMLRKADIPTLEIFGLDPDNEFSPACYFEIILRCTPRFNGVLGMVAHYRPGLGSLVIAAHRMDPVIQLCFDNQIHHKQVKSILGIQLTINFEDSDMSGYMEEVKTLVSEDVKQTLETKIVSTSPSKKQCKQNMLTKEPSDVDMECRL